MNEEQMRAEFEAWWANFQSEHEEWRFADREAILFQAWQAGIKSQAKIVPATAEMTNKALAHDIELPPLPPLWIVPSVEPVDYPEVAQALMDYARAAVEADRKRRGESAVCFKCGHAKHSGECVNVAPQPADKVRELENILNAIFAQCKVVYFPKDGEYPLEHNMAAKKDSKSDILKAIEAMKGE